jgi:protoporphyrinogen/coproporphyrinogen III oxidase
MQRSSLRSPDGYDNSPTDDRTPAMTGRRVAVVGAGITGLAAAYELATGSGQGGSSAACTVTLFDSGATPGGRLASAPFAGVHNVDSGADAFLARVPDAIDLATEVGLADQLVSPEPVGAAVWFNGLHRIPEGLLLGMPGKLAPLATTKLLSWRGKARAAVEPLLPRTSIDDDSIGTLVRARFGSEVHERLVDALVGSIYATDTDRFSLREVPQLYAVAASERSLLLGARRRSIDSSDAGTATATASPIFATPRGGLTQLAQATAEAIRVAGGTVVMASAIDSIEQVGTHWRLTHGGAVGSGVVGGDDPSAGREAFDAVILATPAASTAHLLQAASPATTELLSTAEVADVVMITLHIAPGEWPDRLRGMSGYLVPKPVQRSITAVSFGSQKWSHWKPPSGGEILRVSVGRDGVGVLDRTDDELLAAVLDDLTHHLGVSFTPLAVRLTRWPGAFAQYRPHHHRWVEAVEASLPAGLFVAGSSYRGIGIPACIRDGRLTARRARSFTTGLPQ